MKIEHLILSIFIIQSLAAMDDANYVEAIQRFEKQEQLYDPHTPEVIHNIAPMVERDDSTRELSDPEGTYAIINRPLQHDTLVIGCGHSLENLYLKYYRLAFNVEEEEGKSSLEEIHKSRGHNHSHFKCDTLDSSFIRNPKVLYSMGSREDISEIFKGKTYSVIMMEGCEWYNTLYLGEAQKKRVEKNILQLLQPETGLVIFTGDAIDDDHVKLPSSSSRGDASNCDGNEAEEIFSISRDIRPHLMPGGTEFEGSVMTYNDLLSKITVSRVEG